MHRWAKPMRKIIKFEQAGNYHAGATIIGETAPKFFTFKVSSGDKLFAFRLSNSMLTKYIGNQGQPTGSRFHLYGTIEYTGSENQRQYAKGSIR